MRGSNEKLCFSEMDRDKVWKDYMERIMNGENNCGHNVEGDAVEHPVVFVGRVYVVYALDEMKTLPSEVSLSLLLLAGE